MLLSINNLKTKRKGFRKKSITLIIPLFRIIYIWTCSIFSCWYLATFMLHVLDKLGSNLKLYWSDLMTTCWTVLQLFSPTSDGRKPCFEHLIFESNKIKFTKYVTIVTHVKQICIYFSHKDNTLSRSTYQAMPKL